MDYVIYLPESLYALIPKTSSGIYCRVLLGGLIDLLEHQAKHNCSRLGRYSRAI